MEKSIIEDIYLSIENYLNPQIFGNRENIQTISNHIIEGNIVLIRNAFKEFFVERMFCRLDQFTNWKIYEDYQEHFHYHHHNIYDENSFPPDLTWCNNIFKSNPTKEFIKSLSKKDCDGEAIVSASRYLPGDYSLPHTDLKKHGSEIRQVAFVWHLTKNWQPNWGGDLFWCPKNHYISPSFNTLILFSVSKESFHFVTPVSPYAQSKRLAINGWWTGKISNIIQETEDNSLYIEKDRFIEVI